MVQYLASISIVLPEELQPPSGHLLELEREQAAALAAQGFLLRIWRPRGLEGWHNIGLWQANDENELKQVMSTLPLYPYMTVSLQALDPHPSDPPQPREDA